MKPGEKMSTRQTHFFCFLSRSWKSAVSSKLLTLAGKEAFNLSIVEKINFCSNKTQ